MKPEDFAKLTEEENKKMRKQLDKIFWHMIKRFKPETDRVKWGKCDHWEKPDEIPESGPLVGDCDMFALACRKLLRRIGYPNRLVFCVAKKPPTIGNLAGIQQYQGHLVCEVNGWIFDNYGNQAGVIANNMLMYEWVMISGYEKGDPWHKLLPDKEGELWDFPFYDYWEDREPE